MSVAAKTKKAIADKPLTTAQKLDAVGIEIYTLIDPRDGAVRYIGKAVDSQKRLSKHLRETRRDYPVYRWIAKLRDSGLTPSARVICVCSEDDWREKEIAAINAERAVNARLLNVAAGGDQPYCSKEVRAENGRKVSIARCDTPIKARTYRLKKMMGDMLKKGNVSDSVKAKLREAAFIAPHLFGSWASL